MDLFNLINKSTFRKGGAKLETFPPLEKVEPN
jgi:hypothetical protein